MPSPGASTPADASTLGEASKLKLTSLNVGMNEAGSFAGSQGAKVKTLARHVQVFLAGPDAAVVGFNELHSTIADKVMRVLEQVAPTDNFQIATRGTNSLLWCALSSLLTTQ